MRFKQRQILRGNAVVKLAKRGHVQRLCSQKGILWLSFLNIARNVPQITSSFFRNVFLEGTIVLSLLNIARNGTFTTRPNSEPTRRLLSLAIQSHKERTKIFTFLQGRSKTHKWCNPVEYLKPCTTCDCDRNSLVSSLTPAAHGTLAVDGASLRNNDNPTVNIQ